MTEKIRIGLIGAGRMGATFAHHLAFTVAECDFAAVADPNAETAGQVAARYGASAHYADYRAMLDRADIQAATGLPVFDITTLVRMVHDAVSQGLPPRPA